MPTLEGQLVFCPHCQSFVDIRNLCKSREEAVQKTCPNIVQHYKKNLKL